MPSRINIGPEDGPYVAINESSGNLQLEDNSGNVVAEWDETNAQWDFANNTLNNVDALNSNSVNTEQIGNEWYYAGAYAGSDPDSRLDNAVAAADEGDTILVENALYTTDRTVAKRLNFHGGAVGFSGTAVEADWTFDARVNLLNIQFGAGTTTTINGEFSVIGKGTNSDSAEFVINANDCLYTSSIMGVVTFASGTNRGLVDSCVDTEVTDNGTNSVGDIS